MADLSELIKDIKAVIKENGRREITGQILQDILVAMVENIGAVSTEQMIAAILVETQRAETAEYNIRRMLNDEQKRAMLMENQLGNGIDSEYDRATAAEANLRNEILAENTRAVDAEFELSKRIDAIVQGRDVRDIVPNYQALLDYDTTTLGDNDIIMVLLDNTKSDHTTYYRWHATEQTWEFIGGIAFTYTKTEIDQKFADLHIVLPSFGAASSQEVLEQVDETIRHAGADAQFKIAIPVDDLQGNVTVTYVKTNPMHTYIGVFADDRSELYHITRTIPAPRTYTCEVITKVFATADALASLIKDLYNADPAEGEEKGDIVKLNEALEGKQDIDKMQRVITESDTNYPSSNAVAGYVKGREVFERGSGTNSVVQRGGENKASGLRSFATGEGTIASGELASAEGRITNAYGDVSHAEGSSTLAYGKGSHVEGFGAFLNLIALDDSKKLYKITGYSASLMNALKTRWTQDKCHGLLSYDTAEIVDLEDMVFDEGGKEVTLKFKEPYDKDKVTYSVIAIGKAAHAEGMSTTSVGDQSHSEGFNTTAIGPQAHAEGRDVVAEGLAAHAEGNVTTAKGAASHAEGQKTIAGANMSHAEGNYTITQNNAEHAEGSYNKTNKESNTFGAGVNTIHSVGIGTSEDTRKNAHEIMQNGDHYIYGVGGYNGTNPSTAKTLQAVINSLVNAIESDTLVLKSGTSETNKKVYDLLVLHPQLSKEVVFLNTLTNTYYKINSWKQENGTFKFTHFRIDNGSDIVVVNATLDANGRVS